MSYKVVSKICIILCISIAESYEKQNAKIEQNQKKSWKVSQIVLCSIKLQSVQFQVGSDHCAFYWTLY